MSTDLVEEIDLNMSVPVTEVFKSMYFGIDELNPHDFAEYPIKKIKKKKAPDFYQGVSFDGDLFETECIYGDKPEMRKVHLIRVIQDKLLSVTTSYEVWFVNFERDMVPKKWSSSLIGVFKQKKKGEKKRVLRWRRLDTGANIGDYLGYNEKNELIWKKRRQTFKNKQKFRSEFYKKSKMDKATSQEFYAYVKALYKKYQKIGDHTQRNFFDMDKETGGVFYKHLVRILKYNFSDRYNKMDKSGLSSVELGDLLKEINDDIVSNLAAENAITHSILAARNFSK